MQTGTEKLDAYEAKWALHWCPDCSEEMPCAADGTCLGCDSVIDEAKADAFEEAQIAEAFAEDRWRPRIVVDLTR